MAPKPESGMKSRSTHSGDTGDKGLLVDLKNRSTVPENELQLKHSDSTSTAVIDRMPMGDLMLIRRMVDKAADMVFLLGLGGRILYANEAAGKALGYTREELHSMTVFDINQKHHVDNWREHEEKLRKRGSMTFENVLKTKDNRRIPVEISANYVRLGDKEYNYSFVRDITERKQMEEELRRSRDKLEQRVRERTRELSKSEEKYRELVENANSIIIRWDRQGNLTFFNEFAENLFGYSKNEVLGKNVVGTIVPAFETTGRDLTVLMEDVERYPERYKLNVNENLCKNGDRVWIAWTNRAIRDEHGNVEEILSVGNNITERRRAEEALQFERLQLLSIFDSIDEVIYVADPHTHEILYANRAMQDKFGKSLLGGICYREIQERDAPCEFCTNDIILENKGVPYRWEFHNSIVDRDFEIVDRIIKWPDGRDVRFEIALDVTERKRAEVKVSHLASFPNLNPNPIIETDLDGNPLYVNPSTRRIFPDLVEKGSTHPVLAGLKAVSGELEEEKKSYLVREVEIDRSYFQLTVYKVPDMKALRVYALDITKRKRAEKELREAKTQAELYLDLMGHDINNMHQVALGYLELAKEMPAGADQTVFLDKPMEVLQRSTALIRNVRKLQKLQDGVFKIQDMDLSLLLHDVRKEYGSVPNKRITLKMRHEHCTVRANELLHDVFTNLVLNAIKHTGDKADILMVLDTVKDNDKRYCLVIVEDNGPGILDESKERIFNRTLKGTNKARGMGLGLYLVKSLVESYGGKVWVEDRIKGDHTKGARFVVMLPAVEK